MQIRGLSIETKRLFGEFVPFAPKNVPAKFHACNMKCSVHSLIKSTTRGNEVYIRLNMTKMAFMFEKLTTWDF